MEGIQCPDSRPQSGPPHKISSHGTKELHEDLDLQRAGTKAAQHPQGKNTAVADTPPAEASTCPSV